MNRDDDFFGLPKARNPLRRQPSASEPAKPAPPSAALPAASVAASSGVSTPTPRRTAPSAATSGSMSPPPAPPPPPAAGRRGWLWPLFGLGVVGVVIVGGLLGYWVFMNVAARMLLTDQALTIRLPPEADTVLTATNSIDVTMKGVISAQVPLNQTLDLPIDGTYDTLIDLDTQVPLETTIVYEGIIPIDTMADIEANVPVNFQNVKKYKNLGLKAKLPMKLSLPVKLVVPVKQNIPFKYSGPLRVKINHVIRSPVGTTLNTKLNVNQDFTVPITTSLPIRMQLPQHPVAATIVESYLFLNLETLRLERKQEPPEAAEAPLATPGAAS